VGEGIAKNIVANAYIPLSLGLMKGVEEKNSFRRGKAMAAVCECLNG